MRAAGMEIPVWMIVAVIGALVLMAVATRLWRRRGGRRRSLDHAFDGPAESAEESISVIELERQYGQRQQALLSRQHAVADLRRTLEQRNYESFDLEPLLGAATSQERANLAAILKLTQSASAAALAADLRKSGSHLFGTVARRGEGVAYGEVVRDVAGKLKVPGIRPAASVDEQERAILVSSFDRMLADATPEQRQAILAELAAANPAATVGLSTTAVGLVAAKLSGFALYTAASSTLAAVTGAVGVTLPFSAYMGLSSTLALVTGPVGWVALGVGTIAALGGANYKKTIPAVLLVATVRTRLVAERDQELDALAQEQKALEGEVNRLQELRALLDTVKPLGGEHRIPVADLPR